MIAIPDERTSAVLPTPVGPLTVVAEAGAVTMAHFNVHLHPLPPGATGVPDDDALAPVTEQLGEYFEGTRIEFDLPLAPAGNAFQQRVWALLQTIPYGTTRSYGSLATELGDPKLARAVGSANGRNPIGVVIPCHRVSARTASWSGTPAGWSARSTCCGSSGRLLRCCSERCSRAADSGGVWLG